MRRVVMIVAVAVVGLALVPAAPAAAGGFCSGHIPGEPGYQVALAPPNRVEMRDNCFAPTVLHVDEGATVTFANTDKSTHTVGGVAATFGDLHKEISIGDELAYRFEFEGVFPYACVIHPGMTGAIVVGDGLSKEAAAGFVPVAEPGPPSQGEAKAAGASAEDGGSAAIPILALPLALAVVLLAAALVALTTRHRRAAVKAQ